MIRHNPVWTREELILTLELYFQLGGIIPDVRHPSVIALAAELSELNALDAQTEGHSGRSRAAIIFKLSNLRAIDPEAKIRGKKGLIKGGNKDKAIWDEFSEKPERLRSVAKKIRETIKTGHEELEPLRANLHILRLLGDELIGSERLAIFELVKNSYDADAESVNVKLNIGNDNDSITITDNGCGMSLDTIRNGWLNIGSPSKRIDKTFRTPKYGRMPLGEKGVGRLASFKLGNRLELTTKEAAGTEFRLVMDLETLLESSSKDQTNSVEDVRIRVMPVQPAAVFPKKTDHGTKIRITKLRPDSDWTRGELRKLQKLMSSLSSPFRRTGEFTTTLEVPGQESKLRNLPDIKRLISHAIWEFMFHLDSDGSYHWCFKFNPPAVFRGLNPRQLKTGDENDQELLERVPSDDEDESGLPGRPPRGKLSYSKEDLKGIGSIVGRLYVYDLRPLVLKQLGGSQTIKGILGNQGGMRVYRDGIRVFNYGEPGDDWLGLNIKRVNDPGRTLATNSFIGAIHLSLDHSSDLKEKTNREGFDENATFKQFRGIIQSVVSHLNLLRQPDRNALELLLKGDPIKEDAPVRFQKTIDEILEIASKDEKLHKKIIKPVEKLKKEYETLRDVVASSGAGLNLAIVFHEVEREVRALADGLKKGEEISRLNDRAETLITILDGFGSLLRKASRKTMPISSLIKRVVQLNESRFKAHQIVFSCPILNSEEDDFKATGAFNFYLQVLMNLIDNAIYWVRKKAETEGKKFQRAIQIRVLHEWAAEGPCVAVLDNGPGFSITPDQAMSAYTSTRPGGMGLGLYFARTAMDANGGDLLIPSCIDDLDIDTSLDGAAVVMRFRRAS